MNRTIKHLAESIIDMAGTLGVDIDALPDENADIGVGIRKAEIVTHLREAQRALNAAKTAKDVALAVQAGDPIARAEADAGLFRE